MARRIGIANFLGVKESVAMLSPENSPAEVDKFRFHLIKARNRARRKLFPKLGDVICAASKLHKLVASLLRGEWKHRVDYSDRTYIRLPNGEYRRVQA